MIGKVISDRQRVSFGLLTLALFTLTVAGCQEQTPAKSTVKSTTKKSRQASSLRDNQDHLELAIDFVENYDDFAEQEVLPRVRYHLSKWISNSQPDDDWISDPLFGRLPSRLNLFKGPDALSRLQFNDADISTLRETVWLRDLARQLAARPVSSAQLAEWVDRVRADGNENLANDLATTIEIFDWVIRNIQLEPTFADELAKFPESEVDPNTLGSKRLLWESLLLGRGDALLRARIMILIARQLGIPVVMLGVDQDDSPPRPWGPAAWLNDDLYVFDTRLGVPVPGDDSQGVATLDRIVANPDLLKSMKTDGAPYRVRPRDLKRLVAMIDATPPYLSQRMKIVESHLSGDRKMRLTCTPSVLARQLAENEPAITRVAIWTLPYDTLAQRRALLNNPQALAALSAETLLFSNNSPLMKARRKHFRGQYASDPPDKGAKAHYMDCRVSNQKLDAMTAADLEAIMGGELPKDDARRASLLNAAKQQMAAGKEYASYWLGLIAFEQGHYDVAADFFKKRTLDAYPDGLWKSGATYNLARTYEEMAKTEPSQELLQKARQAYLSDQSSPSGPGNKLRASRLEKTH